MCAPPVQDIRIASFVAHPDYRASSFGTPDIALIRLQKSADLTRRKYPQYQIANLNGEARVEFVHRGFRILK